MTYNSYTQKIIIKNPEEPLKSADLQVKGAKISGFLPLNYEYDKSTGSRANSLEIIAPGFINLHGHLAYTDLKVKSQNLFPWLAELMKKINYKKSGETNFDIYQSNLNGAREAISFGTTFFVDNTNDLDASIEAFKASRLKGLIGLEIFGSDPENAEEILEKQLINVRKKLTNLFGARAGSPHGSITSQKFEFQSSNAMGPSSAAPLKISEFFSDNLDNIAFCLSPHSVYDVSRKLWNLIIDWSSEQGLPILSHIAESLEEENWFKNKIAPEAKNFWREIGTLESKEKYWQEANGSIKYFYEKILCRVSGTNLGCNFKNKTDVLPSPQKQPRNNLKNNPKIILAHGVFADEEDLKLIKENNIALVSCPRSNEYLHNGLPKINLWEELQISYGIGTDSKASNYDLDLRKEANRLGEVFNLSAKRKFELLTTEPAKILGLENQIGTLDEGMNADYTVFEIVPEILIERGFDDLDKLSDEKIFEILFDTEITKVKEVFIGGEKVF